MSYDVSLMEKGTVVTVPWFDEGGTRVMGGTNTANLNITYNYWWFYCKLLDSKDGLYWLHDKQAKDCVSRLTKAVKDLGTRQYKDYWAPTPGNAGHALNILLGWVQLCPEAIFEVV